MSFTIEFEENVKLLRQLNNMPCTPCHFGRNYLAPIISIGEDKVRPTRAFASISCGLLSCAKDDFREYATLCQCKASIVAGKVSNHEVPAKVIKKSIKYEHAKLFPG